MSAAHRVALAYLARHAEGTAPLRRFLESYARHAPGMAHELVVIYKGYAQASELDAARAVFAPLPHRGIEVPDEGFDIGAYLAAAARLDHDYLCFVNSFAEGAAGGWLGQLYRHASAPGVGIAGATGSYESLYTSLRLANKLRWLCNEAKIPYDARFVQYYDFIIGTACRVWKARGAGQPVTLSDALLAQLARVHLRYAGAASLLDVLRPASAARPLDEQYEAHWRTLLQPGRLMADYAQFPPFPNPHIRSNGFMLHRERLLEFGFRVPVTKMEACAFESGADSLTARLRRKGLRAVVVDSAGDGHDVRDWSRSRTFRLQGQEDLVLHDNQTRRFEAMPAGERATHRRMTWGDYAGAPPADLPDLGVDFAIHKPMG